MALTILTVGLLATAGLVRAVSREADQARAEGDAALLAQQEIEGTLSERARPPSSREDTLLFAGRGYIVWVTVEAGEPTLEHIRIDVMQLGPPGFGNGRPKVRSYGTRRRILLPPMVPPAIVVP